jgi:hypothetical protein
MLACERTEYLHFIVFAAFCQEKCGDEPAIEIGAFFPRTESELVLQNCRAVPGRRLGAGFELGRL